MEDGERDSGDLVGPVGTELRTFLIADVRGYTRYTQEHGDEGAAKLAATFAALARKGITERGGQLLELRGDEALGVFASAREALRAAVDLQRLFRKRIDGAPALPLGVGIGLDAGEAVAVEGGYRGGALNLAARLCSLAAPGEILVSETVVNLARRIEGIRFEIRGTSRLKGIEDPVKVIEVTPEMPLPPVPITRWASLRRFRRKHVTRRRAGAAVGVGVVAAAGAVLGVALLSGVDGSPGGADATRVALVQAFDTKAGGDNSYFAPFTEGLLRAERDYGLETETIVVDEFGEPASRERGLAKLRDGDFDLVLWIGGSDGARAFLESDVPKMSDTRFAYIDSAISKSDIDDVPNATALHFRDEQAGHLAGYLSGLMEARRQRPGGKPHVVSAIGGFPDNVPVRLLIDGYVAGARKALPGVTMQIDYSQEFREKAVCEEIANRQMDGGSGVVFAPAGTCGLGALAAAGIRGAWGIGVDGDRSYLGSHILASTFKDWARSVELAVSWYAQGTLPEGKDVLLGLNDEAVGLVGISPDVPQQVRSKLAREAAALRSTEAASSP